MADMQVSTARRIVFTALALVVFWVVAWRAYGVGFADGMARWHWNTATRVQDDLVLLRSLASLCLTFLPAILLSFALYDLRDIWKLVRVRRVDADLHEFDAGWHRRAVVDHRYRRMLIAIILFIVSIEVCYRLGESDASEEHEVSWPWLLLPILTTAFVIYCAWRSAVRDADVDALS